MVVSLFLIVMISMILVTSSTSVALSLHFSALNLDFWARFIDLSDDFLFLFCFPFIVIHSGEGVSLFSIYFLSPFVIMKSLHSILILQKQSSFHLETPQYISNL